ncbi:MAG: tetratricopeptide repeat protein, partial [Gammaproteobacteria bacterium]|nr:tetratricopeptide repeat protein [Gammaproteobacteria bacterium]
MKKNKRKIKKNKSESPANSDSSIVMSLYNSGDYAGMEKAARNLLKQHANSADLNNLLGVSLHKQNNFVDALKYYDIALKIKPEYAGVYRNKAMTLSAAGRDNEAVKIYNQALDLEPNDMDLLNDRGALYQKLGNYDLAMGDFNKVLSLNSSFVNTLKNRA